VVYITTPLIPSCSMAFSVIPILHLKFSNFITLVYFLFCNPFMDYVTTKSRAKVHMSSTKIHKSLDKRDFNIT